MDFIDEQTALEDIYGTDGKQDETQDTEDKELLPREYIARRQHSFYEQYKGKHNLDDEWNKLRSQLNSSLMLGISQDNIDKYATLDYTYEQREVIKYAFFTGIPDTVIAQMLHYKTWGEMVKEMDASRISEEMTRLIDKPLNVISQTLESYVNSFETFQAEMETKKKEYEMRINELELKLTEKEEEINQLYQSIEEKEKAEQEEKEKKRQEEDIRKRAEELANKRFEELIAEKEQTEYNRTQMQLAVLRNIQEYYPDVPDTFIFADSKENHLPVSNNVVHRNGIFGRKRRKKEADISESLQLRKKRFKPEKLPSDFNLSSYMMSTDLSSSQMEIITLAVKTGVDDSVIKQMIDSRLPAQQLKQVLEVILARTGNEKEDVTNDEQ